MIRRGDYGERHGNGDRRSSAGWAKCSRLSGIQALFHRRLRIGFPRAAQDVGHGVVTLMAGVLENWTWSGEEGIFHGPRLGKCRWVVDGDAIKNRIGIYAPEAFR